MNKFKSLFAGCIALLYSAGAWAQCGTEMINITDWCENTYAKWEFNAPTPNASYVWYGYTDVTALTPADFYGSGLIDVGTVGIPKYDSTDASEFYSPFRVQELAIGGTALNIIYQKIINEVAVPYTSSTFSSQPANSTFEIDFTATSAVRINSVKIPVELSSATDLYKLQISFGTSAGPGSAIYEFSALSATNISGNQYLISVPVDYTVPAGTSTLVVNTDPTGSTANQVDGLLFSSNQITPSTGQGIEFGAGAASTTGGDFSVAYDWNYTVVCAPEEAGESNLTTSGCCVIPASAGGSLNMSGDKLVIKDGLENVTFDVTGGGSGSYFAWYKDGAPLMPSNDGVDQIQLVTNEVGVYEVREITDDMRLGDLENPGCFSTVSARVDDQLIELTVDVSPSAPICFGDNYELSATGSSDLTWTATNGLLNSSTGSSVVYSGTGLGSGEVSVTGKVASSNLVVGGDFTGVSNSSIISDYTASTSISSSDGGYNVMADAASAGNGDWSISANDADGTYAQRVTTIPGNPGDFMMVNGGLDASSKPLIWGQKIASGVVPGETYSFSLDFKSVSWMLYSNVDYNDAWQNRGVGEASAVASGPNDANIQDIKLELFVNGVSVGEVGTDFWNDGFELGTTWRSFSFPWTAGTGVTSAALEIRMLTPVSVNKRSNDFGIDNISFGGFTEQTISTSVGPYTDCSSLSATQGACVGDERELTAIAEGGMSFLRWEDESGTTVSTVPVINVAPLAPTTYTAVGQKSLGNVLDNGDFANGNAGFISGGSDFYTYQDPSGSVEAFIITDSPNSINTAFLDDNGLRPSH